MRIERIITKQGHPVPKEAGYAKGPFPPELYAAPELVTDYAPQPDGGDYELPLGATAQNDFQAIKWYRCKNCHNVVSQHEISDHTCEEVNG